jgi:NodT family efflux transporter outer membrane factor (OMF) lipoprotein
MTAVRLAIGALAAVLLVTGCAVGPDFVRPEPPQTESYTAEPVPATTNAAPVAAGEAQHFLAGDEIPAQWWTLFHSPALNALVEEALKANPDLAAAEAALRQAHELTLAGEGAFFPTVQAGFSGSRNKTPTGTLTPAAATNNPYYSLYTAQLGISYVPDVFGGTSRQVEALAATEEAQRFQVEAVYLTLTANVVVAAVTEAAMQAEIAADEESVRTRRNSLDILNRQQALGQVAGGDVAAQAAALAAAEAALPPLQKQLEQQRHLIAVLSGHLPSDQPSPLFDLAPLQLPRDLPLSLPSSLVEHRPDIRAAEAQLHAASAEIGVATANLLPQLSLTGNIGSSALTLASLFGPGTSFWMLAGGATQTIFDGGTLLHKKRAAEAAFDEAAAQYRSTVLTAFQNVADSLRALQFDADALKAAAAAESAAGDSLAIAKRQLALGAVNDLALLNAEQTYAQARLNLVIAEASRFADTAALFQALGGGWWARQAG